MFLFLFFLFSYCFLVKFSFSYWGSILWLNLFLICHHFWGFWGSMFLYTCSYNKSCVWVQVDKNNSPEYWCTSHVWDNVWDNDHYEIVFVFAVGRVVVRVYYIVEIEHTRKNNILFKLFKLLSNLLCLFMNLSLTLMIKPLNPIGLYRRVHL